MAYIPLPSAVKHNNWQGKTALVTGASSGIGMAIARKLAAEGLRVVITARRIDRLEALAEEICGGGGFASVYAADLSNETDRQRLVRYVDASLSGLDVLVNNAGFSWYGFFSNMAWGSAQDMLRVNVEAVVHLTRYFLPAMQAQGSGHIVNIGSIAGGLPAQGIAMYSATKAFLDAFTTSLHRELKGTRVHASILRPGAVKTDLFDAADQHPGGARIPAERFAVPAHRVAEGVWRVLNHPRRVVYVPGWLVVVPWVELCFGWAQDGLGPLLLKRSACSRA